jgi:hypothetical protein
MRQVEVEWDEDAIEHIARHQVEPEEVEEVLAGRYLLFRGDGEDTMFWVGQKQGVICSSCWRDEKGAVLGLLRHET